MNEAQPPDPDIDRQKPLHVVALGGGHGLHASLLALKRLPVDITAIVSVADNGGSSGRLRGELDVIPPGDIRMALAALCDETSPNSRQWRELLQYRFSTEGPLNAHSLGNLLIAAAWKTAEDEVAGLAQISQLIGAVGRVLPVSVEPLTIHADVLGIVQGSEDEPFRVTGQVQVAKTSGKVERVFLTPPDAKATPQALEAVAAADHIILGPGSWYTSVMPHLLISEMETALAESPATKTLVMNLAAQIGETSGMSLADHFTALRRHTPHISLDNVLVDTSTYSHDETLADKVLDSTARLVVRDVVSENGKRVHDAEKLAESYREILFRL